MADTGLKYATSASNDSAVGFAAWSNVNNALTNQTTVYSNVSYGVNGTSNYLKLFITHGIASGKTINGVVFAFYRYATDVDDLGGANDNMVKLIKNGTIQSTNKAGQNWPSGGAAWSSDYGTSSDIWGAGTLTSDDTIGFAISVNLAGSTDEGRIYACRATVYYTDAGGGGATAVTYCFFF